MNSVIKLGGMFLAVDSLQVGPDTNIAYETLEIVPTIYSENTQSGIVGSTAITGPFVFPYDFSTFLNPISTSAIECFNMNSMVVVQPTCTVNFTSELAGLHGEGDHNGIGTVAVLIGIAGEAYNLGTGNVATLSAITADAGTLGVGTPVINEVNGVRVKLLMQNGTITNAYGLHITSPIGGALITNYTGLRIDNPSGVATSTNLAISISGGNSNFGPGQIIVSNGAVNAPSLAFSDSLKAGFISTANGISGAIFTIGDGQTLLRTDYAFGMTVMDSGGIGFSTQNTTSEITGRDTSLSRLAAGSIAIGNGTLLDKSGALFLTTLNMVASAAAPTSAATAGTAGQLIAHGALLYYCSTSGTAGSAAWNQISMVAI
jgi:hypothetical protein